MNEYKNVYAEVKLSWGNSHWGTLNYLGHFVRTVAKGMPHLRSIYSFKVIYSDYIPWTLTGDGRNKTYMTQGFLFLFFSPGDYILLLS